jgi:hypothetical protein
MKQAFEAPAFGEPSAELGDWVLAHRGQSPTTTNAVQIMKDRGTRILEVTQIAAAKGFNNTVGEAMAVSSSEILIYTAESLQGSEAPPSGGAE